MDPNEVKLSDLRAYGLPRNQIDTAFVPEFLLLEEESPAHVSEGIQARHLIPNLQDNHQWERLSSPFDFLPP
jgi:hypothetical protein